MSRITHLRPVLRRQAVVNGNRVVLELHELEDDVAVVVRGRRRRRGRSMLVSRLLELAGAQLEPERRRDHSQLGLFDGAGGETCQNPETS